MPLLRVVYIAQARGTYGDAVAVTRVVEVDRVLVLLDEGVALLNVRMSDDFIGRTRSMKILTLFDAQLCLV